MVPFFLFQSEGWKFGLWYYLSYSLLQVFGFEYDQSLGKIQDHYKRYFFCPPVPELQALVLRAVGFPGGHLDADHCPAVPDL